MTGKAIFYKNGVKVCTTVIDGKDEDEMATNAGFKLMCTYPNVDFDEIKIIEVIEDDEY